VVDLGGGVAIAIRIESHNHPSAVEPYQGAATGVGGILRDVFTMGARPIALMDPLFFGPLEDQESAFVFDGVVRGISGYGNSVGVPTVGGQLTFAPCYRHNPLVNVFCLGLLPVGRLVLGRASGVGNLAVLLGSLTGRDGIGGVSVLASAGLAGRAGGPRSGAATGASETNVTDDDAKRPSVQIGDPFEEKRLIESCLDLLDQGLVAGIQDLGGAGLTCAVSETAARAGLGMDVDCSSVPLREQTMTPVEIMTSESQERMLAIVEPSALDDVLRICRHHEVRATVIGTVTPPVDGVGLVVVRDGEGSVVASLPAKSLADNAPLYRRPLAEPAGSAGAGSPGPMAVSACGPSQRQRDWSEDLLALIEDPSFVYQQYDHQLFLNTVLGPGQSDATILRLAAPGIPESGRGLALTCDANPSWCAVDPRAGAALTVAESALNIACAGARPVAVVDCLNFGNPEHPEVMWQLSEVIDGIASACVAIGVPVVGGNVSLYNETGGEDIDPTPVIAMVGLLDLLERRPVGIALAEGDALVELGPTVSPGAGVEAGEAPALGGSRWAREIHREPGGELPALDLPMHQAVCGLVAGLVAATARFGSPPVPISGVHDVSGGGLAVALSEMCRASGRGVTVDAVANPVELFSEAPSRVLLSTADPAALISLAGTHGVAARVIGRSRGTRLVVEGLVDVDVRSVADAGAGRYDVLAGPPEDPPSTSTSARS
ncbi:MAG: phosphoribosylformylglycinamidine synthase subunit PurL, partial [Acidimicrobiales bacterium]